MKESEFRNTLLKLDTDTSMDKRILEHCLSYGNSNNITKCYSRIKSYLNYIPRVALFIIIITTFGTITTFATIHYVTSYPVDVLTIDDMVIEEYESVRTHVPYKNGDEAFSVLNLPNLVPTYLLDNFKLSLYDNYTYYEEEFPNGMINKQIYTKFISKSGPGRIVYFYYSPSDTSQKNTIVTTVATDDSITTSTYITKNGLTCNIIEKNDDDIFSSSATALIIFDSKSLGNGSLFFDFHDVEMNEIKDILDSIPIKDATLQD